MKETYNFSKSVKNPYLRQPKKQPVTDRDRSKKAAARITERREHLTRAPLAELMTTVHEGHKD